MAGQSARMDAIVQLELFSVADYVKVQIDALAAHKIMGNKSTCWALALGTPPLFGQSCHCPAEFSAVSLEGRCHQLPAQLQMTHSVQTPKQQLHM